MDDRIKLINNDGYGAPELKRVYQSFTFKGLLIAVSIHLVFIAAYMLIGYMNEAKSKELENKRERKIIVVDPKILEPPPPISENDPPVVKEIIEKVKNLSVLTPEPVSVDKADNVLIKTVDELGNLPEMPASRNGDSLIALYDPDKVKIDDKKIDDKFTKDIPRVPIKDTFKDFEVEKPPKCQNLSQVKTSMSYPELAAEIGMEGLVTVKVLVGTDGSVIKVGSLTGPAIFHNEVRNKVTDLQFTPGLQNNVPVKVWVTVPFTFELK